MTRHFQTSSNSTDSPSFRLTREQRNRSRSWVNTPHADRSRTRCRRTRDSLGGRVRRHREDDRVETGFRWIAGKYLRADAREKRAPDLFSAGLIRTDFVGSQAHLGKFRPSTVDVGTAIASALPCDCCALRTIGCSNTANTATPQPTKPFFTMRCLPQRPALRVFSRTITDCFCLQAVGRRAAIHALISAMTASLPTSFSRSWKFPSYSFNVLSADVDVS